MSIIDNRLGNIYKRLDFNDLLTKLSRDWVVVGNRTCWTVLQLGTTLYKLFYSVTLLGNAF